MEACGSSLIGLFLRQTAEGSYQQLALAKAVDDYFWRHHVTSFPVVDGGRVVGTLSSHGWFRRFEGPGSTA